MKSLITTVIASVSVFVVSCGERSTSDSDSRINPGDTVVVPEGYTGEDSVAYIENAILQSPISVEDLLGLAEVHSVEYRLFNYNNSEQAKDNPEYANEFMVTHRDSAAMRLANRFMRMANLVNLNGNANDKLQWAIAVNAIVDTFCVAVPFVQRDSVINEIAVVTERFSSQTQSEMNFRCYIDATIDYYLTIEAYRQWLQDVPSNIRALIQEEYEAWHDLHEARFSFWKDVSYRQEWYSMKPMEVEGYYENLSSNRRAELEIERGIILRNKPYHQKGKTVTMQEWESWIKDNSVPEDIDFLKEMDYKDRIPSDSIVANHVSALKSSFSRWLKSRQAIAAALPQEQGCSYDNLTADIHSRFIGKLASIFPYENW